jgi:hypothetical protein
VTSAAKRRRALIEQACVPLVGQGAWTAEITIEGSRATLVFYRRDLVECERRRSEAADPLRIDHLTTLLQLPTDVPVPLNTLPEPLRHRIQALPHGAVDLSDDHVCRRAVRPLAVDLVVVRAPRTRWDTGLARASRFRPFARRALLVDPSAPDRDDLLMQGAFYGVGVLESTSSGNLEWALLPEAYRPRRHAVVAWDFTERLHARVP